MKYFLLAIIIISCSPIKVIPLKRNYADKPFEQTVEKSKDVVWENIIDFFAKNGLSIRLIDRSSGLIISDKTQLKWTYENSKGGVEFPAAWVAVPKVINTGNNLPYKYLTVHGDWNIRIKEVSGGTLINVNLVNINCYASAYTLASNAPAAMTINGVKTTGVFETMIFDNIK